MKQELEQVELVSNTVGNQKRFELRLKGGVAYVEYLQNQQGIVYLTHTEVPQSLEGMGVGSALIKRVLDHVRHMGAKMAPLCPFVAAYLIKHPEAAEGMLAPGFNIG